MDVERALRDIEQRRLLSLVAPDLDVAEALHADDYELISPSGSTYSKREYLDGIASGDLRYQVFEAASPIRVRVHGDTAIVRYKVRIGFDSTTAADADLFWHTDYYERRSGAWQAVWSQATRILPREPS